MCHWPPRDVHRWFYRRCAGAQACLHLHVVSKARQLLLTMADDFSLTMLPPFQQEKAKKGKEKRPAEDSSDSDNEAKKEKKKKKKHKKKHHGDDERSD